MQTEMRKCLRCDILVKSPNGGTTGLLKHRSTCSKKIPKRKVDRGQLSLGFSKTQKLELAKGFKLITQLVYKEQIPLNTVTKSGALQHMFQTLNYGCVTYHSVNKTLNASYHSIIAKIKELIANRDKDQLLSISFDKWFSQDNKKYIRVYLYVENENVCLGLLNYTGFCGGEEIGRLLVKRLEIFGLTPSDISIAITDCDSDVRSASNILGWHIFPCLAHVVNLCVKNILFRNPSTDVPVYSDDEHQNDEEDLQDGICFELIDIARKISSKIHSTGKLADALSKIQVDSGKTPLQIVRHNETRWNSLYDCLKRFIRLKNFPQLLFVEELSEFDWDRLEEIVKLLEPFKECAFELQSNGANILTAKKVVLFLRAKVRNMSPSVKTVFEKWIDGNSILEAVLKR